MRIAALAVAAILSAAVPSLAAAQSGERAPAPVPIEEWSQDKVSAMGQEIYRQDIASMVATDALLAHLAGVQPAGLAGWIVVPEGNDLKVRFVKSEDGVVSPGWDVVVRNGRAGPVRIVEGGSLSADEMARYRARTTAAENIGRLRCSPRMNSVVAKDPDGDGWLVWLLTSTNDASIVPMGGHYRFRVSADGSTVLRRDMLSNSCLPMPKTPPANGQPVGLVVTQIVSSGPVETHVFLSLQNRLPIYVAAGDQMFSVNGDRIRRVRQ